jgi:hypothetical protein
MRRAAMRACISTSAEQPECHFDQLDPARRYDVRGGRTLARHRARHGRYGCGIRRQAGARHRRHRRLVNGMLPPDAPEAFAADASLTPVVPEETPVQTLQIETSILIASNVPASDAHAANISAAPAPVVAASSGSIILNVAAPAPAAESRSGRLGRVGGAIQRKALETISPAELAADVRRSFRWLPCRHREMRFSRRSRALRRSSPQRAESRRPRRGADGLFAHNGWHDVGLK